MSNVTHLWAIYLGTLIGLLPIINPLSAGPTFLAMTEGDSAEWRQKQAVRGCFYMIAILVSFLIGGTYIMNFFGISIPGLRIAGGILLTGIAMKMLSAPSDAAKAEDDEVHKAAKKKVDISFSPLAMPMLSGPGSIAVTIGLTSLAQEWVDYFAIIAGIVTVAIITYLVLRLSSRMVKLFGPVGVSAMTKIMGFLLMAMGVQFVVNGLLALATDPVMIRTFRTAIAGS
ncbi:MarC family NAAT transporter [Oleiharenicola lentus]|uniref:MarC family NAAT transporter n=1 Tax=Oleiharenicola lentus TaxID=2508720 RepID=UPI003F67F3CC